MGNVTSLLSGGLIDTSAPNYAKVAARNEKQRQALINLGLGQINALYDGGTTAFYNPATGPQVSKKAWNAGAYKSPQAHQRHWRRHDRESIEA